MKKLVQSLFILLFVATAAMAQERTVTGTVISAEDGYPLPGVSVTVKGLSTGTQTNADGKYSIKVSTAKPTLVFSFIGTTTKELSVPASNVLNVRLENDAALLNEVVVTSYGVKAIKDLTGSVASVKGDKIAAEPISSFEQALSGKLAGVQIGSTGGTLGDGVSVRIRGVNSISASSLPLYIIDGIAMNTVENANVFNSGDGTRFNPLSMINSNDIESIEVLKDASAAVLYGSRAANGVIVINTKRGKKGFTTVNFDSKYTISNASKLPSLLNGDQFITISNEKAANAAPRFGNAVNVIAKESDINGDGVNDRTNWLDEVYRTGLGYDNSASISGGSENANYFGSVRYLDQSGILIGNSLKTAQVRLNTDVKPVSWMKAGISLSYSKTNNDGVLTDRYISGITVAALNAAPIISPYNPNHVTGYNLNSNGYLGAGNNTLNLSGTNLIGNVANILPTIAFQKNQNTPEQLLGNIYLEIQPIKGLKFTTKYGIDNLNNYEHQYSSPYVGGLGFSYNGMVQDNYRIRNQWVWQNFVTYDKTINNIHRISATAGAESQFTKERQTYAGANDFSDPFFTEIIDFAYTGTFPGSEEILLWSGGDLFSNGLQSYFVRGGYTFNDKYMVEAAFRADAFSGFGENSKWGYFPSISAGWVASQEDFIKSKEWISFLKVRASFGSVGNSRGIGSYASRTLYGGGAYASQNGFSTSQSGNANLKWETSEKFDIGVDFNILNNKFGFVIDYFNNNISGLVLAATPLYTVGIPGATIDTNIGSMYNRGVEFTVNVETLRKKDFTWRTSFNFTGIKNRVTELVTANTDIPSGNSVASVGRSLGTFKLLRWAGVNPDNGNPMWLTADGVRKTYNPEVTTASQRWTLDDGSVTSAISGSDAVYTGKSGLPRYYGGLDNNFTYKNFDLGISLVYTGGFSIYNTTRSNLLTNTFLNNSTEILDRWTTPGQNTNVPRLFLTDQTANQASTRFLEKGDFLRARSISLGYNFKDLNLSKVGINNLRVYGQVYNAFVLTGYSGTDPEVNSNRNNSNIAIGVDSRSVPQPRVYTLGLSISLQ
jgi:TonB-linked SusC/RagA family outer membrane protein